MENLSHHHHHHQKNGLPNFIVVVQIRVLPNVLDAQLKMLHLKNLEWFTPQNWAIGDWKWLLISDFEWSSVGYERAKRKVFAAFDKNWLQMERWDNFKGVLEVFLTAD